MLYIAHAAVLTRYFLKGETTVGENIMATTKIRNNHVRGGIYPYHIFLIGRGEASSMLYIHNRRSQGGTSSLSYIHNRRSQGGA